VRSLNGRRRKVLVIYRRVGSHLQPPEWAAEAVDATAALPGAAGCPQGIAVAGTAR